MARLRTVACFAAALLSHGHLAGAIATRPSPETWDDIVFYHFNDVYNLANIDHVAKYVEILHSAKQGIDVLGIDPAENRHLDRRNQPSLAPLTIFSGDAFNPAPEAMVLQGDHMVPLLNELGIDVACYGNHDFDFGEARLTNLSRRTNFPWVMSNLVAREDPDTDERDRLLAQAAPYMVKTHGRYRVGFFGLAGTDWPASCKGLPGSSLVLDPVEVAQERARHLRLVENCDFVIALTHLRLREDLRVSEATLEGPGRVDMLLGGHDHEVAQRFAGDSDIDPTVIRQGYDNGAITKNGRVHDYEGSDLRIVKSGTDWKGLSVLRLRVGTGMGSRPTIQSAKLSQFTNLKEYPSFQPIPPNNVAKNILKDIGNQFGQAVKDDVFHSRVGLDGREESIRNAETNLGNMIADAIRAFFGTQVAIMNSGSIRPNRIVGPTMGPTAEVNDTNALTVQDVLSIMSFENTFVVKSVRGSALVEALENSLSNGHRDGRFLQVSGARFIASWGKPQGSRVLGVSLALPGVARSFAADTDGAEEDGSDDNYEIDQTPIDLDELYTVAMPEFLADGGDDYTVFKTEQTLDSETAGMTDRRVLFSAFGYKDPGPEGGHQSPATDELLRQPAEEAETIVAMTPTQYSRSLQNLLGHGHVRQSARGVREGGEETEDYLADMAKRVWQVRRAIVRSYVGGLPVVAPRTDGRITFV